METNSYQSYIDYETAYYDGKITAIELQKAHKKFGITFIASALYRTYREYEEAYKLGKISQPTRAYAKRKFNVKTTNRNAMYSTIKEYEDAYMRGEIHKTTLKRAYNRLGNPNQTVIEEPKTIDCENEIEKLFRLGILDEQTYSTALEKSKEIKEETERNKRLKEIKDGEEKVRKNNKYTSIGLLTMAYQDGEITSGEYYMTKCVMMEDQLESFKVAEEERIKNTSHDDIVVVNRADYKTIVDAVMALSKSIGINDSSKK